jgi:hypothetical protein
MRNKVLQMLEKEKVWALEGFGILYWVLLIVEVAEAVVLVWVLRD